MYFDFVRDFCLWLIDVTIINDRKRKTDVVCVYDIWDFYFLCGFIASTTKELPCTYTDLLRSQVLWSSEEEKPWELVFIRQRTVSFVVTQLSGRLKQSAYQAELSLVFKED